MATSSYSTLFGTNGAGQTGSQAGISTLFGQQRRPRQQTFGGQQQPAQTFAQLQQQGMARPAPQAPQGQPFQQFGGSQQAQQARSGMLTQLQQQLAQPTRFDTDAFQQIRGAQAANLQAEYQGQQSQLNEELARRGLSASSIGGGRMGDLAGQQARALAGLDAQLLQAAAQTQAQDRLAAMQAAGQFADLAGSQDLAQFEANRVAQAAEFQQALQSAQFGQGQYEFNRGQALQAAQAQQQGGLQGMDLELRRQLGLGELGLSERRQTAQETQFGQSLAEQTAARLQQAGLSGRELDLRAQQLQQEAGLQGRSLSIEEARLAAQQEQFTKTQAQQAAQFEATLSADEKQFVRTLKEQQDTRLQQLGISTKELDLRAQQIKDDARLRGQEISNTQARDTAEIEYRGKALEQQAKLAGQEITAEAARQTAQLQFQRDQLAVEKTLRESGIDVDKLRIESAEKQFDKQLAEQTAGRTQQATQFALTQAQQQAETRSQQTGLSFRVDEDGKVVADIDPITGQQLTTLQGQQFKQQAADALAERTLRDKLARAQLTSQEKVALDEIVARKELQAQQLAQQAAEAGGLVQVGFEETTDSNGNIKRIPVFKTTLQAQQLAQQATEAKLERELRSAMQTRELTSQENRALDEINLRKQQLAQQAAEASGKVQVGTRIIQQPDGSIIEEPIYGDTVQAQQLAQQQRVQEAELTGKYTKDGVVIDTLAAQQFGQAKAAQLADQAARQSQLTGFMYKVNKLGQLELERDASGQPITTEARRAQVAQESQATLDRQLRQQLGFAEYTGTIGGQQTMAAQQAQQQLLIQLASVLAGSSAGIPANLMESLNKILGVNQTTTTTQTPRAQVGDLTPDGAYRWNGTSWEPVVPAGTPGPTGAPGGQIV